MGIPGSKKAFVSSFPRGPAASMVFQAYAAMCSSLFEVFSVCVQPLTAAAASAKYWFSIYTEE